MEKKRGMSREQRRETIGKVSLDSSTMLFPFLKSSRSAFYISHSLLPSSLDARRIVSSTFHHVEPRKKI